MAKKVLIAVFILAGIFLCQYTICLAQEVSKEKIIDIATTTVKDSGIELKEVDIIYDQDGQIWNQKVGYLAGEDKSPNHGILRKGFLKNYRIVYFDFKAPIKDVWVFIDKDTGEVLTVYRE